MCAFLLLAGARRHVPTKAHVLVHEIWLGKKSKQAQRLSYTAEEFSIVQRDIGRLAQYTVEMGGLANFWKLRCGSHLGRLRVGFPPMSCGACA
jgi:hypothetical protein